RADGTDDAPDCAVPYARPRPRPDQVGGGTVTFRAARARGAMRIKSEIWVRAYLRRCQSEGVPVLIVRRGDESAGAIFICVDRLDGTVALYGPAPAGSTGSETDRRWISCFPSPAVGE